MSGGTHSEASALGLGQGTRGVTVPRVVVLNGPAGVGKTTTGRLLASMVDNGACVHGDALKHFIVNRRDGSVGQGLGYVNGATVVSNFVDAGYDLVVFEYVFEKPRGLDVFRRAYSGVAPVHLFTLWAELDDVLERERTRLNRERLGPRVTECYRTMEQHLGQLGTKLDTSRATAPEIARQILDRCARGEGLLTHGHPLHASAA